MSVWIATLVKIFGKGEQGYTPVKLADRLIIFDRTGLTVGCASASAEKLERPYRI